MAFSHRGLLLVGLAGWHISGTCRQQRQTKFEAKELIVESGDVAIAAKERQGDA
jgi:hypothetical protein